MMDGNVFQFEGEIKEKKKNDVGVLDQGNHDSMYENLMYLSFFL